MLQAFQRQNQNRNLNMYDEHESFILVKNIVDKTIPKGTIGVVLMVLDTAPYTYIVEFPDNKGGNLGSVESLTYIITETFMQKM